jgi:2-oxo-3-hexenedioate decarboxylase/2-keto-4-pentenoate hydratase
VPLPADLRPADLGEAYAAQEALHRLYRDAGRGEIGGAKVAITTKVMQRLMGIDEPCGGAVFATEIHVSPASLRLADFGQVAVECEIAVRLGRDLPGGQSRDEVAASIASCHAAIELIDDARAEYKRFDALNLVADNAWNGGLVLGPAVRDWRHLDLAALKGSMSVGGRVAGHGTGADVLGHPLNALVWLADTLARRGRPLRAGMAITTGSIVATQWPKAGETVEVEIEGLGKASARFE